MLASKRSKFLSLAARIEEIIALDSSCKSTSARPHCKDNPKQSRAPIAGLIASVEKK